MPHPQIALGPEASPSLTPGIGDPAPSPRIETGPGAAPGFTTETSPA